MSEAPLLIVDGSSYLYRAFHALPPLSTADGRPTGAIYGVVNMLRRVLQQEKPDRIAVVFDAPGPTFRDQLYAEYKANRQAMPDDLAAQVEPLLQIVTALGLPMIRIAGVEADDVIATIARHAEQQGARVLIATGDKDMAQLVNQHISLVDTMRNVRLDEQAVKQKYGVDPKHIVDLLALMGDTSDNIPGIPGVGPKTACRWLEQYGSLVEVRRHASEIKGKAGESLRDHLQNLDLYVQLATVRDDLPLDFDGDHSLVRREPHIKRLRELYTSLEFHRWRDELAEPTAPAAHARNYVLIQDESTLKSWIEKIDRAKMFALDVETTSLDYLAARIVGMSFAVGAGQAAYLPLAHELQVGRPFDREQVLERLQPILENPRRAKVGHHLKYDAHVLANHGIRLAGIRHDTLLESYVLNPSGGRHDLDSLAENVLGEKTIHYSDVAGKGSRHIGFAAVSLPTASSYASEDADMTWRLHAALWPKLSAEPTLCKVYTDIELPLAQVLLGMERRGVLIDSGQLQAQSRELSERMHVLEGEVWDLAGREFNLGSPMQLADVLYRQMGLVAPRKTPKGQPSTSEAALAELSGDHPLPAKVLEYRALAKLRSTYTEKLPLSINPQTGRVHTIYNQTGTSTGRLSSSDPNLQNIPVRTAEGRRIRQAFIAPPGWRVVAADYSQIELRIMAHLSEDAGLLKAFAQGRDIHRATAGEVFGCPIEQVTADQRRAAKAINFGLIYGMSAFGLSRQLGIGREEAQSYVNRYFDRYPGVRDYMDLIRHRARDQGYVETIFGRRLYVQDIDNRNGQRRQAAERAAINAPMQGSAADIIKRAMLAVYQWCSSEDVQVHLLMQVHDELVFEVKESALDEAVARIRRDMEDAAHLRVPLLTQVGIGFNWDEAH